MASSEEDTPLRDQIGIFNQARKRKLVKKVRRRDNPKKKKKGEPVKPVANRRTYKKCPICGCPNRQVPRHIKSVHKNESRKVISDALRAVRPYNLKRKKDMSPDKKCPICHEYRIDLKSHLTRVHWVVHGLKEVEGYPDTVTAVRAAKHGIYQEVENELLEYEKLHFSSLAGARRSVKPETTAKNKSRKLTAVRNLLYWLVTNTQKTAIQDLCLELDALGNVEDGYFSSKETSSSSSVYQLGALREFIQYLDHHSKITSDIAKKCSYTIGQLQCNLSRPMGAARARKQEADVSLKVTPEHLAQVYASQAAKQAQEMLGQKKVPVHRLKCRDVAKVRNYLIFHLMEKNLLRPCALYRLTVTQIKSSKKPDKSELYRVPVFYDKTVASTGQASYLDLSDSDMAELLTYISVYRWKISPATRECGDDLFLLENGKHLSSDDISRCQRTFWLEAGKDVPGFPLAANSRHIRKCGNDLMHELGSAELKESAPDVLNHLPETNRRFYRSMSRGDNVGRAKAALFKLKKKLQTTEQETGKFGTFSCHS
jgi:hypothetical protein